MNLLTRRILPLAVAMFVILLFGGCEHGQRALTPLVEGNNPNALYRLPPMTDEESDVVYLTIDDGPGDLTPDMLDLLEEFDATATLFLHTDYIEDDDVLDRAIAEGHNLAHHMPSDRDWTEVSPEMFKAKFRESHCILARYGEGYAPYFRPPRAGFDDETMLPVLREAEMLGERPVVLATYIPWDAGGVTEWRWRGASRALAKRYGWGLGLVARPGDIVLFHDGPSPRLRRTAQSLVSLEIFLKRIDERGLRAVALPNGPANTAMCPDGGA
ncbi:MAG: polysaccharide deacetylase family protein [Pseudomonadota bacterium]